MAGQPRLLPSARKRHEQVVLVRIEPQADRRALATSSTGVAGHIVNAACARLSLIYDQDCTMRDRPHHFPTHWHLGMVVVKPGQGSHSLQRTEIGYWLLVICLLSINHST